MCNKLVDFLIQRDKKGAIVFAPLQGSTAAEKLSPELRSDLQTMVYLDEKGKEQLIVMGCYGIGVGRTAAASIEQNHDENGIIWPLPIAPFAVEVVPVGGDDQVQEVGQKIYESLNREGIEVLLDNRPEAAGVKFKDADLIGLPLRVTVGSKGLARGEVEIRDRKTGTVTAVKKETVLPALRERLLVA